eukprot:6481029-Amphidinium_carterae.2
MQHSRHRCMPIEPEMHRTLPKKRHSGVRATPLKWMASWFVRDDTLRGLLASQPFLCKRSFWQDALIRVPYLAVSQVPEGIKLPQRGTRPSIK